jgi:peptidoglycan L-alanyl-D-glutamate endopeptidase CwlK
MPSRSKADLHPLLVAAYDKTVKHYADLNPSAPQPFITCTYRTNEEQEQLFRKRPKVTNARAGQSPHNYKPSYAFDIAFIGVDKKLDWNNKHFKNFADIIKSIEPQVEWGGDWAKFKDAPHFQVRHWNKLL